MKPTKYLLIALSFFFKLHAQTDTSLIDFFLPMTPQASLVSSGTWGPDILPRDTANGLEDPKMENWCYWDGSIVKDDDGKYHLYASRWSQSFHHSIAWKEDSKAVHAVSDDAMGPYEDLGLTWPYWNQGKASNTIGLRMHDGRYALITSEITPGNIFVSDSPNGPFHYLGDIQVDYNGYPPGYAHYNFAPHHMSNVMVIIRPDGRYMIMARQCVPMISDNGILGPYKLLAEAAWKNIPGVPQTKMEDPTIWYSDHLYHCVVNYHGGEGDTTFHLTSLNGVDCWKNRGRAFQKEHGVFRYTDGTEDNWYMVQRPTVFIENDKVSHFNFSVLDVHKGDDNGNDNHGSKVIVVPFDGDGFSDYIQNILQNENELVEATPIPVEWGSVNIGSVGHPGNSGYSSEDEFIKVDAAGFGIGNNSDELRFVYQQVTGDVTIMTQIMTMDLSDEECLAGVMIRQSLDPGSPSASLMLTHNNGALIQTRTSSNGSITSQGGAAVMAPQWLMLTKVDNSIVASVSSNNKLNWEDIGTITLEVGTDFYIGLVTASGNSDELTTVRFRKPEVLVHADSDFDYILSHDLPATIPTSGEFTVNVKYLTSQARDIVVGIRNITDWYGQGSARATVNGSGTVTISFSPSSPLIAEHNYQLEIDLRPVGGNWTTNLMETLKVKTYFEQETVLVEQISIPESITVKEWKTYTMNPIVLPVNASDSAITWETRNSNIAQVDIAQGIVYGISAGSTYVIAHSNDGAATDSCLVTVNPSSISSNNADDETAIFPNPFETELNILLPSDAKYKTAVIMDVTGKTLWNKNITGQEQITINPSYNTISKGIFFLQLTGTNRVKTYIILRS